VLESHDKRPSLFLKGKGNMLQNGIYLPSG